MKTEGNNELSNFGKAYFEQICSRQSKLCLSEEMCEMFRVMKTQFPNVSWLKNQPYLECCFSDPEVVMRTIKKGKKTEVPLREHHLHMKDRKNGNANLIDTFCGIICR